MQKYNTAIIRCILFATALSLFSGCASRYYDKGMSAIKQGDFEQGIALLERGMKKYPHDTPLRTQYLHQKMRVLDALLAQGDRALANGLYDTAEALYQRAQVLAPEHARALASVEQTRVARRHAQWLTQAHDAFKKGESDATEALLRRIRAENPDHVGAKELQRKISDQAVDRSFDAPTLNSLYRSPITLELRDTNIRVALEILSKTSGINFALDKEVRPDLLITLFVRNTSIEEAVNLILSSYQLKKKIINDKTVLIYPNQPEKIKEYENLAFKAIYLTNVDARKMTETIRGLVKTRNIMVDERLNVLLLRDNIETIRAVENLVTLLDVPDPEVMLEVEVLEVQSSRLHDLGIKFPDQVSFNVLSGAAGASSTSGLTLQDLENIGKSNISVSPLGIGINLKRELSDANVLANPSIRARNREKAKIKIGDRVPVITTTQNVTSNSASDNVQYLDVGLNVEVEPDIRMDNEVAIKLTMEVSNVVKEVRGGFGSIAYQIGTRNITTVLRLKDGETQILGGLIRDDERQVSSRFPGLGDLPIIGRLFSSNHNEKLKTEIILAITPHVIRNVYRPAAADGQFWSGTEDNFIVDKPWATPAAVTPTLLSPDSPNATLPPPEGPGASPPPPEERPRSSPPLVSPFR